MLPPLSVAFSSAETQQYDVDAGDDDDGSKEERKDQENDGDDNLSQESDAPSSFVLLRNNVAFASQLPMFRASPFNANAFKAAQLLIIGFLAGRLSLEPKMHKNEMSKWMEEHFEDVASQLYESFPEWWPADFLPSHLGKSSYGTKSSDKSEFNLLTGKNMWRRAQDLKSGHNSEFTTCFRR